MANCPTCNAPIAPDTKRCASCGSLAATVAPGALSSVQPVIEADDGANPFAPFDSALAKDPRDFNALKGMLALAEELGDAVRKSRCLATMAQLSTSPKDRADFLIRASQVTLEERGEPLKAAAGLQAALQIDPDRVDAFLTLTQIFSNQGNYLKLEEAYRMMIGLHANRDDANPLILAKLWRKLGALLASPTFNRHEDAALALEQAKEYAPHDLKTLATALEIYQAWPGHRAEAIAVLSEIVVREENPTQQVEDLRTLGTLYLEEGLRDAGFCLFRALNALGEAEEREKVFVQKLQRVVPKIPEDAPSASLWTRAIYTKGFPYEVAQVMTLIAKGLMDGLENDLAHHGVSLKDRLDPEAPLLINTLIKRVARVFGLQGTPEIYARDEVEGGLINGVLNPAGFIVDKGLLAGRSPAELAFVVGRNLALLKEDFFLAGVSPLSDLQVFIMAATKFVQPQAPIPNSKAIDWTLRGLNSMPESQQHALRELLGGMIERHASLDLENYVNSVELTANRLGLIVCDDLEVAMRQVLSAIDAPGTLSEEAKIDDLLRYSVSTEYIELRHELGLTVA